MKRVRFGLTTWQKTILWAGVLLCIWRFLQVPAIFDAIMNFYGAGVVPGTDIVLSPDGAMYLMLSALALVAAGIIYLTKVAKLHPARPNTPPIVIIVHQTADVPMAAKPRKPRGLYLAKTRDRAVRIWTGLICFWRPRLAATWRVTRLVARRIGAIIMFAAHDFWQWFAPYAHDLDAWLDQTLNSRRTSGAIIQVGRETTRVVGEARKKLVELNQRAQSHSRE